MAAAPHIRKTEARLSKPRIQSSRCKKRAADECALQHLHGIAWHSTGWHGKENNLPTQGAATRVHAWRMVPGGCAMLHYHAPRTLHAWQRTSQPKYRSECWACSWFPHQSHFAIDATVGHRSIVISGTL
eukprot:364505-Chlamydomonas_euryale.AAC.4